MGKNAKDLLGVDPIRQQQRKRPVHTPPCGRGVPAFSISLNQPLSFFLIASITASLEVALTVNSMPSFS